MSALMEIGREQERCRKSIPIICGELPNNNAALMCLTSSFYLDYSPINTRFSANFRVRQLPQKVIL